MGMHLKETVSTSFPILFTLSLTIIFMFHSKLSYHFSCCNLVKYHKLKSIVHSELG
jgi:hypothetical protein